MFAKPTLWERKRICETGKVWGKLLVQCPRPLLAFWYWLRVHETKVLYLLDASETFSPFLIAGSYSTTPETEGLHSYLAFCTSFQRGSYLAAGVSTASTRSTEGQVASETHIRLHRKEREENIRKWSGRDWMWPLTTGRCKRATRQTKLQDLVREGLCNWHSSHLFLRGKGVATGQTPK